MQRSIFGVSTLAVLLFLNAFTNIVNTIYAVYGTLF